jgi:hypothetical protein
VLQSEDRGNDPQVGMGGPRVVSVAAVAPVGTVQDAVLDTDEVVGDEAQDALAIQAASSSRSS